MDTSTRNYLAAATREPWRWEDDRSAAVWRDGETIAFREEILAVLTRLKPQGLPPLGPILLVLAAARDNWSEAQSRSAFFPELVTLAASTGRLPDLKAGLDRVHALPKKLRTSLSAKVVLCEMIFEQSPIRASQALGESVLAELGAGLDESLPSLKPPDDGSLSLPKLHRHYARVLLPGLEALSIEALELRAETGLETLPEPATEAADAIDWVKTLLAGLAEEQDELGGVATLARQLMASITLPRRPADPDELALGGVSDVSNRGPLDRLLLSELAHDDLTLAVRIATNEALYLRREAPPRDRPRQRLVLLDSGLRGWGVPRVVGTSIALAVAADDDPKTITHLYRSQGRNITPVELSREGLVAHLAALEKDLHPGSALAALQQTADESEVESEAVLVTTPEVWADPEFQAHFAATELAGWIIALVHRDGAITLFGQGTLSRILKKTISVDLETLVPRANKKSLPLLDPNTPEDWPAILRQRLPLLVPHSVEPARSWHVPNVGVFCITRDRRLTLWTRTDHGPRELVQRLPATTLLYSSGLTATGEVYLALGFQKQVEFHLLKVEPKAFQVSTQVIRLSAPPLGVQLYHGVLYVRQRDAIMLIEPATARVLGRCRLASPRDVGIGPYFRNSDSHLWYLVSYDGVSTQAELTLPQAQEHKSAEIQHIFTPDGVEGAIALTNAGHLLHLGQNLHQEIEHGLGERVTVVEVSKDQRHVLICPPNASERKGPAVILDIVSGQVNPCPLDKHLFSIRAIRETAHPRPIRCNIEAVGCRATGELLLFTSRGKVLRLVSAHDRVWRLEMLLTNEWSTAQKKQSLRPLKREPGGFSLRKAVWEDGSEAWLDSRGMLHLRSSQSQLPEMTLVLQDNNVAVWCSNGLVSGDPYLTGEPNEKHAHEAIHRLVETFVRTLK
jgi:hypothetical protein